MSARSPLYRTADQRTLKVFRRYPDTEAARWQISTFGGTSPKWSETGKQLFYEDLDGRRMVVSVRTDGDFRTGRPERAMSGNVS